MEAPPPAGIYGALAKAQGELVNVEATSTNPHFRSRYADLGAILAVVSPVLSRHGIALVQSPYNAPDGAVGVVTQLFYEDGSSVLSTLEITPEKANAHGVGSAITYARRYTLAALVGVAQDDDDGNEAVASPGRSLAKPAKKRAKKAAPPEDEGSTIRAWLDARREHPEWRQILDRNGLIVGNDMAPGGNTIEGTISQLKEAARDLQNAIKGATS